MPQGGELKLEIKSIYLPKKEKDFIQILISDQGGGIPPENLNKIFERYFTTKEAGTGLGLAVVDRIIKSHNGFITVESKLNQMTTFGVHLPI